MGLTFEDRKRIQAAEDLRVRASLKIKAKPRPQVQCRALCANGHRCRWTARPFHDFCGVHDEVQPWGVATH
jgi:hypothetical protein